MAASMVLLEEEPLQVAFWSFVFHLICFRLILDPPVNWDLLSSPHFLLLELQIQDAQWSHLPPSGPGTIYMLTTSLPVILNPTSPLSSGACSMMSHKFLKCLTSRLELSCKNAFPLCFPLWLLLSLYYYNSTISIGEGTNVRFHLLLNIFIPVVHSESGKTTKVGVESFQAHFEVNLSTVSF